MWHKTEMRILLAGMVIILFAAASCSAPAQPSPDNGISAMNAPLPPDTRIVRDPHHDTVVYLKGSDLSAGLETDEAFRKLRAENRSAEIALRFIAAHSRLFRLADPAGELRVSDSSTDELGLTHVRFQQLYRSIPVSGAEIIVHLDRDNRVYLVNGRYIPTPDQIDLQPGITASMARSIVARHLGIAGDDDAVATAGLVILPGRDGGPTRLAFRTEAAIRVDEGWVCFVDAQTGAVLEKQSAVRFRR